MKVCFIGHRKIDREEIYDKTLKIIENLINERGVNEFCFGTRSEFNFLCNKIVSYFKLSNPQINRICFFSNNEADCNVEEQIRFEKFLTKYFKKDIKLLKFDESYYDIKLEKCNKNSYIIRNYCMIDFCDICVFYFNENYMAINKSKKITKSGTLIALEYAKKKNKEIIFV